MRSLVTTLISMYALIGSLSAQSAYLKTSKAFRTNYIDQHEVVKGKDRQYFSFFTLDSSYRINGIFEKITDTTGFTMKTSDGGTQVYFKYGKVRFDLLDTSLQLFVYQSKALLYTSYKDYLFIPFTDKTTGDQSYGSGRYLDLLISDIKQDRLMIDFNKAYNPYCAYAAGYHCPLPPKENYVAVAIKAGEKSFRKNKH